MDGIEEVGGTVQQIASIAQRSQDSVEQGRDAAERLEKLAQDLNASLSRPVTICRLAKMCLHTAVTK